MRGPDIRRLVYPECPECGQQADCRPLEVAEATYCTFVPWRHADDCPNRFRACVEPSGEVTMEPLGEETYEERVMGVACR